MVNKAAYFVSEEHTILDLGHATAWSSARRIRGKKDRVGPNAYLDRPLWL